MNTTPPSMNTTLQAAPDRRNRRFERCVVPLVRSHTPRLGHSTRAPLTRIQAAPVAFSAHG